MPLTEGDHVIEALSTDGSNQTFDISVLPRRASGGRAVPKPTARRSQTKSTQSPKSGKLEISSRKLAPFSERGGAVLFENVAAVEVAVVAEVVVDGCVGGGKCL